MCFHATYLFGSRQHAIHHSFYLAFILPWRNMYLHDRMEFSSWVRITSLHKSKCRTRKTNQRVPFFLLFLLSFQVLITSLTWLILFSLKSLLFQVAGVMLHSAPSSSPSPYHSLSSNATAQTPPRCSTNISKPTGAVACGKAEFVILPVRYVQCNKNLDCQSTRSIGFEAVAFKKGVTLDTSATNQEFTGITRLCLCVPSVYDDVSLI